MVNINPNHDPANYFVSAINPLHRQYLALRRFFVDGHSANQISLEFGYSVATVYSLVRDFKEKFASEPEDPFFKESKSGRPKIDHGGEISRLIVAYRKNYLSVPEIKAALDAQNIKVSER